MSYTPPQRDQSLILVIDDDRTVRIVLRRAMEQEGYQVEEACDGNEGLDAYMRLQPDIVLLDAMMPVMDGFSCCSHLQLLPGGDRTPILMITGLDDQDSVDQAFEAGAIDYVTKPIHLPVLRQRVRRLLAASRVMAELRQQTERERLLRKVSEQIRESLDLEQILNTTVIEIRQLLQVDRVVVYHFNFESGGYGQVIAEASGSEWIPLLGSTACDAWLEECTGFHQQGNTYAIPNVQQVIFSSEVSEFLSLHQVKAALTVPISQGDQLWGLLIAHQCSQPRIWNAFEIDSLKQLATQVTLAIQQAQLHEKIRRLATYDSLTQIANRHRFDEYLETELQRMARNQMPLALILCDIDFFKSYNDTYGHLKGDYCLQQVAKAISQTTKRPADLVARYGGEEFAVILPDTSGEGAMLLAEEILHRVQALHIKHDGSDIDPYVTLSLGVASRTPSPDLFPALLIAAADKALYRAKALGRNRVVQHEFHDLQPISKGS